MHQRLNHPQKDPKRVSALALLTTLALPVRAQPDLSMLQADVVPAMAGEQILLPTVPADAPDTEQWTRMLGQVWARNVSRPSLCPPMAQTVDKGPRPEIFLAIAADDPLFRQVGLNLVEEWLAQSPAVGFHLHSGGSHGFGMRQQGTTSDLWIEQYLAWLALQ